MNAINDILAFPYPWNELLKPNGFGDRRNFKNPAMMNQLKGLRRPHWRILLLHLSDRVPIVKEDGTLVHVPRLLRLPIEFQTTLTSFIRISSSLISKKALNEFEASIAPFDAELTRCTRIMATRSFGPTSVWEERLKRLAKKLKSKSADLSVDAPVSVKSPVDSPPPHPLDSPIFDSFDVTGSESESSPSASTEPCDRLSFKLIESDLVQNFILELRGWIDGQGLNSSRTTSQKRSADSLDLSEFTRLSVEEATAGLMSVFPAESITLSALRSLLDQLISIDHLTEDPAFRFVGEKIIVNQLMNSEETFSRAIVHSVGKFVELNPASGICAVVVPLAVETDKLKDCRSKQLNTLLRSLVAFHLPCDHLQSLLCEMLEWFPTFGEGTSCCFGIVDELFGRNDFQFLNDGLHRVVSRFCSSLETQPKDKSLAMLLGKFVGSYGFCLSAEDVSNLTNSLFVNKTLLKRGLLMSLKKLANYN